MNNLRKKTNFYAGFGVFLISYLIYFFTAAKTLTFWDSGEFITAGSILGIAHPPGSPFYILLARFATLKAFFLSAAQAINLMSVSFSSLSAVLLYLISESILNRLFKDKISVYFGAIFIALLGAFSYSLWQSSTEAEVYSGLIFFDLLIIFLTLKWTELQQNYSHQNFLLLIIYLFFLGFGVHQTVLQIFPAIIFIIFYDKLISGNKEFYLKLIAGIILLFATYAILNPIGMKLQIPILSKLIFALLTILLLIISTRKYFSKQFILTSIFLVIVGLSTHIYIIVRTQYQPFLNHGHPHNLRMFLDYILRRQYGNTTFLHRRASFIYQITQQYIPYFTHQFFNVDFLKNASGLSSKLISSFINLFILGFGFLGISISYNKNKKIFWTIFSLFLTSSIIMVYVINLSNAEVRSRDYFFILSYLIWTIWIGIGIAGVVNFIKKDVFKYLILGILLIFPILNIISQYKVQNRSKNKFAVNYGANILNSLEKNAILFTLGDNDTFPTWYLQAVKDKNVYQHRYLSKEKYPDSNSKLLDFRKKRCKGIRQDVSIVNLSLLNLHWYLRQIRDTENIAFNLPDNKIKQILPYQVSKDLRIPIASQNHKEVAFIKIKKGTNLTISQQVMIKILQDNFGKRPIYFMSTIPDLQLIAPNYSYEGVVSKFGKFSKDNQINIKRLETNLNRVYNFSGIFNPDIYKTDTVRRLYSTYGEAYLKASDYYRLHKNNSDALRYYEEGIKFFDNKEPLIPALSDLYLVNSEPERALSLLFDSLKKHPYDYDLNVKAGLLLCDFKKYDDGLNLLENAVYINPKLKTAVELIFKITTQMKFYNKGTDLMQRIYDSNHSPEVKDYLDKLQSLKSAQGKK